MFTERPMLEFMGAEFTTVKNEKQLKCPSKENCDIFILWNTTQQQKRGEKTTAKCNHIGNSHRHNSE
jgi:hypothetical protein